MLHRILFGQIEKTDPHVIIHGQLSNYYFLPKSDVTIPNDGKC